MYSLVSFLLFYYFPFFFFTFHSSLTRISCIMPSVSTYSTILYWDVSHGFHPSACVYIFTNHNASLELMLRCSCRKEKFHSLVLLHCCFGLFISAIIGVDVLPFTFCNLISNWPHVLWFIKAVVIYFFGYMGDREKGCKHIIYISHYKVYVMHMLARPSLYLNIQQTLQH